jgi:hypothetical protein
VGQLKDKMDDGWTDMVRGNANSKTMLDGVCTRPWKSYWEGAGTFMVIGQLIIAGTDTHSAGGIDVPRRSGNG